MLALLQGASMALTDSGGIQEETTALGVPCLTLRENTERPITVTEGTNTIVGADPDTNTRYCAEYVARRRQGRANPGILGWTGRPAHR
jgi:UDP-N-acetylglucosamine 2-epimerase (non-hydrolysing)